MLLDLHPVRACTAGLSACLDLARQMDRAALQQQLFRQRGLTRVRVRDDRESTSVRLTWIGHGLPERGLSAQLRPLLSRIGNNRVRDRFEVRVFVAFFGWLEHHLNSN